MQTPMLNFEKLKKCKQTYNELSYQGFVLNVARSFRTGIITEEEKDLLLFHD